MLIVMMDIFPEMTLAEFFYSVITNLSSGGSRTTGRRTTTREGTSPRFVPIFSEKPIKLKKKISVSPEEHIFTYWQSGLSQTHNFGNTANIGIRGFTSENKKNPVAKCYPPLGIEPRPLMNH